MIGRELDAACDRAIRALVAADDSPLVLAVSGGGDSMALLHLLARQVAHRRELICFTVDHGLRPEARDEVGFVARTCASLAIPHQRLVWHTPRAQQADARDARHGLLAKAARRAGARQILTGHTADDQDETFLMRIRQGSGWFGLSGMDPVSVSPVWPEGRSVQLVRPLLNVPREILRGWLRAHGLGWCDDPSNEDLSYERVRTRQLLDKAPAIRSRIQSCRAGLTRLRRAELGRLSTLVAERVVPMEDASLRIDPTDIPGGTLARLLSLLIQVAAGHARAPRGKALRELVDEVASGGPQAARTLSGAWLAREGGSIVLARDPGLCAHPPGPRELIWDGRFVRDTSAGPLRTSGRLARAGLPPEAAGWRSLNGQRLAELSNCWQKLSSL